MLIPRWVANLRIRYKLFLVYSGVLLLAAGVGMIALDSYVRDSIEEHTETEMKRATALVINAVRTAAAASIKNYLRASAENNREIVNHFYQEYASGHLSETEAKEAARSILLSQGIGKTGYIFVWDIRNAPDSIVLAVHPMMEGQDVSGIDFVQEGVNLKTGYMEYRWKNPGEAQHRDKAMYLTYFEPWQWIIAASSYKEEFLQLINVHDFRENILSVNIGRTGYFYVIDSDGNMIIHPKIDGNVYYSTDEAGRFFFQEMCSQKTGKLSYSWKNPGESTYRSKIVFFDYIPEFDWIVTSSGYVDEFKKPLYATRGIVLLGTGLTILLVLVISFMLGSFINRPLRNLIDAFERDARNLTARLPVTSTDEIGQLALHFNRFMDHLEQESLERKAAEKALAEEAIRRRILIEQSKDGIVVLDQNGKVYEANQSFAEMLGYSAKEVLQLHVWDWDAQWSRAELEEKIRLLDSAGAHFETRHRRKDGTVYDVEISTNEAVFAGQRLVFCVCRDITERRKAEEERGKLEVQLFHAQKMESVGRLAGGVAHDFNNMLGVIIGHAEMALEQLKPDEPLYQCLLEIQKASNRSADLTRQLLAYARKQTASPRVLDLNETISKMLKMLQRLIGEEIDLVWSPAQRLWKVRVDPSQIDQILANLAVNARDAISGIGSITLKTENIAMDASHCPDCEEFVPGDYVLLTVSDTGEGMDKETVDHIFEPFFTTKEVGRGTGLGLATVYGIVKQNNGFISVESRPEMGSSFGIYLPRFETECGQSMDEKGVLEPRGGREAILLVEDDELMLDLSKKMIESLGYTVLTARSPKEAIGVFENCSEDIELLITDVVMPEMNGRELATRIRGIRPDLKCLYMSGYTADMIAHRGVLEEGVHFIHKPFGRNDLAGKIREVLDED